MTRRIVMTTAILAGLCLPGCNDAPQDRPWQEGKVRVFVSIPPQAEFVRAVGGEHVDVRILLPPGHSPATYDPPIGRVQRLGEAQVLFLAGVPMEANVRRALRDRQGPKLVDLNRGIELRSMQEHAHDGHEHAGGRDPHTWLDPELVKRQAETIAATLVEIDPGRSEIYEENLRAFRSELGRLDAEIAETLEPVSGRTMYVFHPAYGYFAGAYGLKQRAIEVQGKQPQPMQMQEFIDRARREGARVIFVQPQFSKRSAERIAEAIDGEVVTLDPLAEDYMSNLREMARKTADALKAHPSETNVEEEHDHDHAGH